MSEDDKNQHLSSIISDIQDYGPDSADDSEDRRVGASTEADSEEMDYGEEDDLDYATAPASTGWRRVLLPLSVAILTALLLVAVYIGDSRLRAVEASSAASAPVQAQAAHEHQFDFSLLSATDHSHPPAFELSELQGELNALHEQLGSLQQAPAVVAAPTPVPTPSASPSPSPTISLSWYLNLNSYASRSRAERWVSELTNAPAPVTVVAISSNERTLYRVRLGPFTSREQALAKMPEVSSLWGVKGAWVQVE